MCCTLWTGLWAALATGRYRLLDEVRVRVRVRVRARVRRYRLLDEVLLLAPAG